MGRDTKIEWCDSTCNGQIGCNGCELWSPTTGGTCYAAALVNRYGGPGNKGYPNAFDQPEIYGYRIEQACRWPDLTGTARPSKPWLDGYPRAIFLDDLGDTFTEALPIDWLEPFIEAMESSPHIWQILTKRPHRMRTFFERVGRVPSNFWLMTSVTRQANAHRVARLLEIPGASCYGVSYEPMLGPVDFTPYLEHLDWLVLGGESGPGARSFATGDLAAAVRHGQQSGVRIFVKQFGSKPEGVELRDRKGGDWSEWPRDLRIREMPPIPCDQLQETA